MGLRQKTGPADTRGMGVAAVHQPVLPPGGTRCAGRHARTPLPHRLLANKVEQRQLLNLRIGLECSLISHLLVLEVGNALIISRSSARERSPSSWMERFSGRR